MEPDWSEVERRLGALTVRELRAIASRRFNGCLGGASTKADVAHEMTAQMRHWWRCGKRGRVADVMDGLEG